MEHFQICAALTAIFISIVFWPPKNKAFLRRGIDPGFLDLKAWPARIWFFFKGHDIVDQAYSQDKETPYLLQSLNKDYLVLPPRYLSELRMLPATKLSASLALVTSVLGQHSGVDVILKDRQGYDIARLQLTKSLPTIVPILSRKIDEILSETLSASPDSEFIPINIKELSRALVLRTTLLTFVGPDLCDDADLQFVVEEFTNIVRDMAILMLFIPKFLRRIVQPFLPPTARMRRLHEQARRILFSRLDTAEEKRVFSTVVDHFVSTSQSVDEKDIVAKFLVLMAGALHTTKMSLSHAIIDLCASPECLPTLRDEIARHQPGDASPWQFDQVARLKTLDSFLKESQRFNPPNYLKFQRIATSTFALQDGTIIPEGTCISMPAGPMAMDPEYYCDPQKFSATRFCTPDNTGLERGESFHRTLEFVDTENGNLHWGHGRFTCPGRWYASAVMKLMLAKIIEKYDVRFPEGQTERMPNVYMDLIVEPNPKQVVLFGLRG